MCTLIYIFDQSWLCLQIKMTTNYKFVVRFLIIMKLLFVNRMWKTIFSYDHMHMQYVLRKKHENCWFKRKEVYNSTPSKHLPLSLSLSLHKFMWASHFAIQIMHDLLFIVFIKYKTLHVNLKLLKFREVMCEGYGFKATMRNLEHDTTNFFTNIYGTKYNLLLNSLWS